MNKQVSNSLKVLSCLVVVLTVMSSFGIVTITSINGFGDPDASGRYSRTGYIPEVLNFTMDGYDDFEAFEETSQNLTQVENEMGDGKLRLSTGLHDMTIQGAFSSSQPVYAETIRMKPGAVWSPDNTDSIEIYARNFIMERDSIISVSGVGNSMMGRGDDGEDDNSRYSGGGGGGGGGYGDIGGKGGAGSSRRGRVDGGNGGNQHGGTNSYDILTGCKGGTGGHAFTTPGDGGPGGGKLVIISETISINGTIMVNGVKGGDGLNGNGNNADTDGGGGGGSGGGMMIVGKSIEVLHKGDLQAFGGSGGDGGTFVGNRADAGGGGGGGSGGRIKIFNETQIPNAVNITVDFKGGSGGSGGDAPDASRRGDSGLVGETGTFSINPMEFESQLNYMASGFYISKALNTNNTTPHFDSLSYSCEIPVGTLMDIYTQTAPSKGTDPKVPGNWSEWSNSYTDDHSEILSQDQQWIRFKIVFRNTGVDPHATPLLDWVKIEYHTDEAPSNMRLGIKPTTINAATGEISVFSIIFTDTDRLSPAIFSGLIKLRDNSTGKEIVVYNGVFTESENCEIRLTDDEYSLNYTFSPEPYINDGLWQVYFELYDGITESGIIDYNDTDKKLEIFSNFQPYLDPESLVANPTTIPIKWNYTTTISFELEDADPHPIEDFKFTFSLKMLNSSTEIEIVKEMKIAEIPELQIVGTRGKYNFNYSYDPSENTEVGKYEIFISVEDSMGASSAIEIEDTDVMLELLMNTPPAPPYWILPNETAEQNPRIAWSKAIDNDGDPVTYSIQIGTKPYSRDVLVRTSTGMNNFYDVTISLPFGDYYIQVWAMDPYFTSPVFQEKLSLSKGLNSAPRPPTIISPDFTDKVFPNITWSGAYDLDKDNLEYFIQIGERPSGGEIISKQSTGHFEHYTLMKPLERGMDYYVQIWAYDGKEESYPREEILSILTKGNHRPNPPTAIYPDVTGDQLPTIFWTDGIDVDGDELTYFIQVGKSRGSGDILHWTPTESKTSFDMPFNLTYGTYYVQVKCTDTKLESEILEEILKIWATGNVPPTAPTSIEPMFTKQRFPDISWKGAHDENVGDLDRLFYFIQIGSSLDGNEFLAWHLVTKPYYNVTKYLTDGVYYVQIMTSDGMGNSSVFQREIFVGTFKPIVSFYKDKLEVQSGGAYEINLTVSNMGTLPDIIALNIQDINDFNIKLKYSDILLDNIPLAPGEFVEIVLTVEVLNTYKFANQVINITATSLSGTTTTAILRIGESGDSGESWIGNFSEKAWFWPLVSIIILFLIFLIVLVVVIRKKRNLGGKYEFTEMVESDSKSVIKKKRTGNVTRISDTPIMDPRAKRIAMAIYTAQSPALAAPKRNERLQLPSSTQNLPKIMVPDMAVGSTLSKKAQAIKALPQFSVVKDTRDTQAGQTADITGLGATPSVSKQAPSVAMSPMTSQGTVKLEPQVSSERISEATTKILEVQMKMVEFRNKGMNMSEADIKLMEANQCFGKMDMGGLDRCIGEIKLIFQRLESQGAGSAPLPDFEISAPVAPAVMPTPAPVAPVVMPTPAPAPAAPAVIPTPTPEAPAQAPAPSSPAPHPDMPAPPETPPADGTAVTGETKDVFGDLQKLIDGMK